MINPDKETIFCLYAEVSNQTKQNFAIATMLIMICSRQSKKLKCRCYFAIHMYVNANTANTHSTIKGRSLGVTLKSTDS